MIEWKGKKKPNIKGWQNNESVRFGPHPPIFSMIEGVGDMLAIIIKFNMKSLT